MGDIGDQAQRSVPHTTGAEDSAESKAAGSATRIANAVTFLNDQRIRHVPLDRKVRFLTRKGLSAEEICESFTAVGQPQQLQLVQQLQQEVPTSSSVTRKAVNSGAAPPPEAVPTYAQRDYSRPSHPHYNVDSVGMLEGQSWKDYVIAAGALVLGGFFAYKAYDRYSPYEIRRRDYRSVERPPGHGCPRRGRRAVERPRVSSSSDMEYRGRPLPQLPATAEVAPAGSTDPAAAPEAAGGRVSEEVGRLQTELAETKELLDKERKGRAELAVMNGKLKAQVQQLSRTNEKNADTIKRLQEEIDKHAQKAEVQEMGEGAKMDSADADAKERSDAAASGTLPAGNEGPAAETLQSAATFTEPLDVAGLPPPQAVEPALPVDTQNTIPAPVLVEPSAQVSGPSDTVAPTIPAPLLDEE